VFFVLNVQLGMHIEIIVVNDEFLAPPDVLPSVHLDGNLLELLLSSTVKERSAWGLSLP
jgi:hypothetical protein